VGLKSAMVCSNCLSEEARPGQTYVSNGDIAELHQPHHFLSDLIYFYHAISVFISSLPNLWGANVCRHFLTFERYGVYVKPTNQPVILY
jgi:hypothetical protein